MTNAAATARDPGDTVALQNDATRTESLHATAATVTMDLARAPSGSNALASQGTRAASATTVECALGKLDTGSTASVSFEPLALNGGSAELCTGSVVVGRPVLPLGRGRRPTARR